MNIDVKEIFQGAGRWILLALMVAAAWALVETAVHPMMQAAPFAKTMSALVGYGLVATLVCFMRWTPLQPLLAPLFDEIRHLASMARTGKEGGISLPHTVRAAAMVAIGIYGGLTFSAIVIAGAMLAGISH